MSEGFFAPRLRFALGNAMKVRRPPQLEASEAAHFQILKEFVSRKGLDGNEACGDIRFDVET